MTRSKIGPPAGTVFAALLLGTLLPGGNARADGDKVEKTVARGLEWLAGHQSAKGSWSAAAQGAVGVGSAKPLPWLKATPLRKPSGERYAVPLTALAGIALLSEGSTTAQGAWAPHLRRAVDFLLGRSRRDGLLADAGDESSYIHGHGYAMLFLSQVLQSEQDPARRAKLVDTLTRAAAFSAKAQTAKGGWGYVSAEGGDFDEGSTTVTQIQGLRGCRDAGIRIPVGVLEKAAQYIRKSTGPDGGVTYSLAARGAGRPPLTAAALASFGGGEPKGLPRAAMLKFCRDRLADGSAEIGHWHYCYLYYAQVAYREGDATWERFRDKFYPVLVARAGPDGAWNESTEIGPCFATAVSLTILQLEKNAVPIFRR